MNKDNIYGEEVFYFPVGLNDYFDELTISSIRLIYSLIYSLNERKILPELVLTRDIKDLTITYSFNDLKTKMGKNDKQVSINTVKRSIKEIGESGIFFTKEYYVGKEKYIDFLYPTLLTQKYLSEGK